MRVQIHKERAYLRNALFAIELIDAVTLSRISQGIKVVAEGLRGKPFINASGMFVWLKEDRSALKKISIASTTLPYQDVEVPVEELQLPPPDPLSPSPLTTIGLPPRADYPFPAGITGVRGTLIEERVAPPSPPIPVKGAEVSLRWLDEDGVTWRNSPIRSRTDDNGDFVSILRLAPTEVPGLDAIGTLMVRLRARRDGTDRQSADVKILQGRITDPSTMSALTFAWDELQP